MHFARAASTEQSLQHHLLGLAAISKTYCRLQNLLSPPKLTLTSRAYYQLQSLLPSPELAATSKACCQPPKLAYHHIQHLLLSLKLAAAFKAYRYLQSLFTTASRACCRQCLSPPLELVTPPKLAAVSQSLLPPSPDIAAASRYC